MVATWPGVRLPTFKVLQFWKLFLICVHFEACNFYCNLALFHIIAEKRQKIDTSEWYLSINKSYYSKASEDIIIKFE